MQKSLILNVDQDGEEGGWAAHVWDQIASSVSRRKATCCWELIHPQHTCACVRGFTFVSVWKQQYVYIFLGVCLLTFTHTRACVFVCVRTCGRACVCVCACMFECLCESFHLCVYFCYLGSAIFIKTVTVVTSIGWNPVPQYWFDILKFFFQCSRLDKGKLSTVPETRDVGLTFKAIKFFCPCWSYFDDFSVGSPLNLF